VSKNPGFVEYEKARNEEAIKDKFYTDLWDTYYQSLLRYALAHNVKFKELAEDVVMETFTTALKRYDELSTHPNLGGWMFTTLKNTMLNRYRKAVKHKVENIDAIIDVVINEVASDETITLCRECLSDEMFQLLEAYHITGMTLDELAVSYNITKPAIKQRLNRIYHKVRENLKKFYSFLPLLLVVFRHI